MAAALEAVVVTFVAPARLGGRMVARMNHVYPSMSACNMAATLDVITFVAGGEFCIF